MFIVDFTQDYLIVKEKNIPIRFHFCPLFWWVQDFQVASMSGATVVQW